MLGMHPGPQYQPVVLRFTAPTAGIVQVVATFYPGDVGIMTVAVRVNNVNQWSHSDSGTFPTTNYTVAVGDTIDFTVYGAYYNGNTGLIASITYIGNELIYLNLLFCLKFASKVLPKQTKQTKQNKQANKQTKKNKQTKQTNKTNKTKQNKQNKQTHKQTHKHTNKHKQTHKQAGSSKFIKKLHPLQHFWVYVSVSFC